MQPADKLRAEMSGDRDLVISRGFDAPRHLVFDAHTRPELIRRWLLGPPGWTMPVCEVDLKVGGAIRYVWRGPDDRTMGMSGVFREIVRPERIVHTEVFDEDWSGGEMLVTTVLRETAGRTTVIMTIRFASSTARETALATGMTGGVGQSYDRLTEQLRGIATAEGSKP